MSYSYQLKVIARLAEKLMKKLATPTDHTHSILPDVVTTHQHKKHAQQSLKRFMKVEMCQLQQESRFINLSSHYLSLPLSPSLPSPLCPPLSPLSPSLYQY